VDLTIEGDVNADGVSGNERPNAVGNWRIDHPSASQLKSGSTWFNVDAFESVKAGEMGSLGRNTVPGPSFRNFDLSLAMRFRVSEEHALSFRLETTTCSTS